MTLAIEAVGLVKRFGKTLAVDGVDLAVRPGMVLGLLGPNGAGKTTVVLVSPRAQPGSLSIGSRVFSEGLHWSNVGRFPSGRSCRSSTGRSSTLAVECCPGVGGKR